jgi:hypothetical protein
LGGAGTRNWRGAHKRSEGIFVLNPFKIYRQFRAIQRIAIRGGCQRGLLKRIDENRELLEALQEHAPELLKSRPWIAGWLECNDEFFVEMATILDVKSPPHLKNYPRPRIFTSTRP